MKFYFCGDARKLVLSKPQKKFLILLKKIDENWSPKCITQNTLSVCIGILKS